MLNPFQAVSKICSFTAISTFFAVIVLGSRKHFSNINRKVVILSLLVIITPSLNPLFASGDDPLNFASGPVKDFPSETEKIMYKEFLSAMELLKDPKDQESSREGMEKLRKLIAEHPRNSDLYYIKAIYLYIFSRSKEYTEIFDDLNNAIKFHSMVPLHRTFANTASMLALRAKIHIETGSLQQAMKDLETAVNANHREAIIPSQISPAVTHKTDSTERIQLMLELEQRDPSLLTKDESEELATLRANGEIPAGHSEYESEEVHLAWKESDFNTLIKKYPKDYRGYLFRAVYYSNSIIMKPEGYKAAVADLNKTISLNPKCAKAHYLLGEILAWGPQKSDQEYLKEGIFNYTNAIKADPKIKEAYSARAGLYRSSEKYVLAIKDYDKVIELDPDDGDAYYQRGFISNKIGKYWNAIEDFTQALKSKKKVSFIDQTYLSRGNAHNSIGQFTESINDYTKAIEWKIGEVVILLNLPQIRSIFPEYNNLDDETLLAHLRDKYHPNMELETFSKLLLRENRKFGDFIASEIFVNRGDTYLKLGRYVKGMEDYKKAEQIWEGYSPERWKYLFDGSKARAYLDITTVEKTDKNSYNFWLKYEYKKAKPKGVSYSVQNTTVDCSSKKINTFSKIEYDADGNVKSTYDIPSGWSVVIPDTIGEIIYKGWCTINGSPRSGEIPVEPLR